MEAASSSWPAWYYVASSIRRGKILQNAFSCFEAGMLITYGRSITAQITSAVFIELVVGGVSQQYFIGGIFPFASAIIMLIWFLTRTARFFTFQESAQTPATVCWFNRCKDIIDTPYNTNRRFHGYKIARFRISFMVILSIGLLGIKCPEGRAQLVLCLFCNLRLFFIVAFSSFWKFMHSYETWRCFDFSLCILLCSTIRKALDVYRVVHT